MTRGLNHQQHHPSTPQLNGTTESHGGKKDKKNRNQNSKSQNLNPQRIVYQVKTANL
jgi:hypothetical protein